jgi:hypothetical protein
MRKGEGSVARDLTPSPFYPRTKEKGPASLQALDIYGVPTGIRTPVTAVKGRCPRPLDDGDPDDGVTRQL